MERGYSCQKIGTPDESLVPYVLRRLAAGPSSPLRPSALGAAKCPDVSMPSTAARYRVSELSGDNALLVASRPPGLLYTLHWLVWRRINRRQGRMHVD